MKATPWVLMVLVWAASCSPAPAIGVPETPGPVLLTPTPAPTSSPMLPPALTPLPAATATASPEPIFKSVKMSAADQEVYDSAMEDIERYRKGDVTLFLRDPSGQPLAGYQVEYVQVDHDFWFGASGYHPTSSLLKAVDERGDSPSAMLVHPAEKRGVRV